VLPRRFLRAVLANVDRGPGGAYDAANPANAAKFDAADAEALADEAGLTLIQMAVAFVVRHPAVTSAIIGPLTMEQLDGYLAADGSSYPPTCSIASTRSSPAATINIADNMWNIGTTALAAASRRR
jgi:aryl-alcohol dehydrogenase-like predicted oxidoreductase